MSNVDKSAKLKALRQSFYLKHLKDTVFVPARVERRVEEIKPIAAVTLDDIAFALIALQEKSSALHLEAEALRSLSDIARKNGALGSDIAIDAIPDEGEGV